MAAGFEPKWNSRLAPAITGVYIAFLTYLLLTPEPLTLFFGASAGEIHGAVEATVSGYTQHTISYAVLTSLLVWTLSLRGNPSLLISAAVAFGHALLTEGLQRFVPNRHADLLDLLADLAGIVTVTAAVGAASFYQRALFVQSVRPESAPQDA
jgi:VanZ family protein